MLQKTRMYVHEHAKLTQVLHITLHGCIHVHVHVHVHICDSARENQTKGARNYAIKNELVSLLHLLLYL